MRIVSTPLFRPEIESTMYLLLFAALVSTAIGSATLSVPKETFAISRGDSANGWTPKPTQAPLKRRALGAIDSNNLLPRQINSHTCGYWDGNPSYPLDCGSTALCETFTNVPQPYFGCCNVVNGTVPQSECVYRGTCLSYGAENNGQETGYTVVSSTLFWYAIRVTSRL